MRRFALRLALLAAALAIGGFVVASAGLIPISATSGHWSLTAWFLHFTMQRSVATSSIGVKTPPLDDPALVLRGAGHYETGCLPCHGAPGQPRPLVVRKMTPAPPYLPPRVREWQPAELFTIVKYGIKFSAMPAWPARQRDDEVWAVVAFLLRLPEMEPADYRRAVYGESGETAPLPSNRQEPLADVIASCVRCHGENGAGRNGVAPRLSGQRETYLLAALRAYADNRRYSGIMQPIVTGMDEATMRRLAEYFAGKAGGKPQPAKVDAAALARGERIATQGLPAKGVPACVECHGPQPTPRNPHFPKLAGQYADYLNLQLELFKQGKRGGSPYAHIMRTIAERLSEAQMRDVAHYFETLRDRRTTDQALPGTRPP